MAQASQWETKIPEVQLFFYLPENFIGDLNVNLVPKS